MATLELGFQPLLRERFPDRTLFIDTRFRWRDTRSYDRRREGPARRLLGLARALGRAGWVSHRQPYDVVVSRCLGPVNSEGQSWAGHAARVVMGAVFRSLVLYAARGGRVKLAVLDQTDHISIHPRDRKLLRRCQLYFKRELADNHWHTLEAVLPRGACAGATRHLPAGVALRAKLRPFSLGIEVAAITRPLPDREKAYDLFYAGTAAGIPVREGLDAVLAAVAGMGWRVFAPRERLTSDGFREAVRRSRLCLSPGGVGWDCYRHYEVVAYGSLPVMNYRPTQSIAPFRHGCECFYYDPQGDLTGRLDEWLRLPGERLDRMVAAAQEHLRRHFTFDALAEYVVRELERLPDSTA